MKKNKEEFTDKEIRDILKKKRLNNQTCTLFKKIGIKNLGDKKMFDKMTRSEIEYYYKHFKRLNEKK
tara:strand:+ start:463 stop:663 length:201 start_codon:yes stop_codon:yes gene_type:complete